MRCGMSSRGTEVTVKARVVEGAGAGKLQKILCRFQQAVNEPRKVTAVDLGQLVVF